MNARFVRLTAFLAGALSVLATVSVQADWRDLMNQFTSNDTVQQAAGALSETEIADGLRQALGEGVRSAVASLGRPDGFLGDAAVRIPMPKHLGAVEDGLRAIGKADVADQFVTSMNRAAEQAVPEAAEVFANAVSAMTVEDAKAILDGTETAATDYLKRTSTDDLRARFAPMVDGALRAVDATAAYQRMLDKAGPMAALIDTKKLSLDGYVTDKALDGLFHVIGQTERDIRANPAARTTSLLKKVFGS